MLTRTAVRRLLVVIPFLFTACAGQGSPGALPDASVNASTLPLDLGSRDLLYISSPEHAYVYSYPNPKEIQMLQGVDDDGGGDCVDAAGNVYVTLGTDVAVYAHGSTKSMKTLGGLRAAEGCNINLANGDLAVADLGNGTGAGLYVYKNAKGKPTAYTNPAFSAYWFCGYDAKGNLFVDGRSYSGGFVLAELPVGGTKLESVAVTQKFDWPGGIQWDGKYVVVGDAERPVLYRFDVTNLKASLQGTVNLGKPAWNEYSFFLYKGQVIVPNACRGCKWGSDVLFFKYPEGGKYTKIIAKPLEGPLGVVISPATEKSSIGGNPAP